MSHQSAFGFLLPKFGIVWSFSGQGQSEMLANSRTFHHRLNEHGNRSRDITITRLPSTDGPAALDADKARKALGAEAKGVAG